MGQKGAVNTDPEGAGTSLLLPTGSQAPWNRGRKWYFSKSLYLNSGSEAPWACAPEPLTAGAPWFLLRGRTVTMGEQQKGRKMGASGLLWILLVVTASENSSVTRPYEQKGERFMDFIFPSPHINSARLNQ